jgi:hypothetical protein
MAIGITKYGQYGVDDIISAPSSNDDIVYSYTGDDKVYGNNLFGEQLLENPFLAQTLWQALETTHSLLRDFATAGDFTAKMALS